MDLSLRRGGRRIRAILSNARQGAEGKVCRIDGIVDQVVKIHEDPVPADLEERYEYQVDHPPHTIIDRVAWPLDIVEDTRGQVVGYLQHFYGPPYTSLAEVLNNLRPPKWLSADELRRIAHELAYILAELHAAEYLFPDLHPGQFLCAPGRPTVAVDTGSCQFKVGGQVFCCRVARDDYQSPELVTATDRDAAMRQRDVHADDFSLGTLLFQIAVGCLPFQGVYVGTGPDPTLVERIAGGRFPFAKDCRDFRPPPAAPPYCDVHPDLRQLFHECFVVGHDPQQRRLRPTAARWADTLKHCPALRSVPVGASGSRAGTSTPSGSARGSYRLGAGVLAAVALAAVSFQLGTWYSSSPSRRSLWKDRFGAHFSSLPDASSPSAEEILDRFRRETPPELRR